MKIALISATILMFTTPLFGQGTAVLKQWDKTFVVAISHTGSMSGGSSRATFTYDSCTYVSTSLDDSPTKKKFALTQGNREEILKKLHELKVDKITPGFAIAAENDGWSTLLCFGAHCIEGGSASRLTDQDKDRFLTAYRFLEDFATK